MMALLKRGWPSQTGLAILSVSGRRKGPEANSSGADGNVKIWPEPNLQSPGKNRAWVGRLRTRWSDERVGCRRVDHPVRLELAPFFLSGRPHFVSPDLLGISSEESTSGVTVTCETGLRCGFAANAHRAARTWRTLHEFYDLR